MHKELEQAEESGRKGDALLGHLTPGDVVIPRGKVSPLLRELLSQLFDVDIYTAGSEKNSINPVTGLAEFNDDAGYSPESAALAGDISGLGLSPPGGGANSAGPGSLGAQQNGWGGFVDSLNNFFANSSPAPADAMDSMGMNGLSGENPPTMDNPLLPQGQPVNFGTTIAPLAPPTSPNVPDSLPQIGQYYALMRQGNTAGAENLLSQFMRGDTNVYGR